MAISNPAYHGHPNGGTITIGPSHASPNYHTIQPGTNFNYDFTGPPIKTSLEVFEEIVGLIRLLEAKLSLDPKDHDKDKWLEKVMGRIQEETLNDTIQRLRALKI